MFSRSDLKSIRNEIVSVFRQNSLYSIEPSSLVSTLYLVNKQKVYLSIKNEYYKRDVEPLIESISFSYRLQNTVLKHYRFTLRISSSGRVYCSFNYYNCDELPYSERQRLVKNIKVSLKKEPFILNAQSIFSALTDLYLFQRKNAIEEDDIVDIDINNIKEYKERMQLLYDTY